MKIIANNKKAYHDFFVITPFEAGIKLVGCEVKSIRLGNVSLKESFIYIDKDNQVFIKNMYIKKYEKTTDKEVDERSDRRLLLHKKEIKKLKEGVKEKGYAIMPLKLYLKGSLVKLEIAVCKGKHLYDKKAVLKEKDIKKETLRQLKEINH